MRARRLILRDGAIARRRRASTRFRRLLRMRLPKHRRERSAGWSDPCIFLFFYRLRTVPVPGGPGSAMHHFAALALHRVRDDPRARSYSYSPFQTALLVPAAHFLRPGFASFASLTRIEGERSAERRSGVCETPVGHAMTRRVRRLRGALRPMTRDARLSALHRGGFGHRVRAFQSPNTRLGSPL
jgi:hypothetical protein